MRYSEILNESQILTITSMETLEKALSYGEIRLPSKSKFILNIYDLGALIEFPPNFTIYGNTFLQGKVKKINGGLIIYGDLEINIEVHKIDSDMVINGNLFVIGSGVEIMNGSLKIEDNFHSEGNSLLSLPKYVKIDGDYIQLLGGGPHKNYPQSLVVGGDMYFDEPQKLPSGLDLEGYIYLYEKNNSDIPGSSEGNLRRMKRKNPEYADRIFLKSVPE